MTGDIAKDHTHRFKNDYFVLEILKYLILYEGIKSFKKETVKNTSCIQDKEMEENVVVVIKLFSGIDKELSLKGYDPSEGLKLGYKKNIRLGKVLKDLGISKKKGPYVFFRNGDRINRWTKLFHGDEVSCLRPSGGG